MVTNFGEAEIRSKIIKAMAYYARLIVIEFLKGLEHSFLEIFALFQLDKSTVSKHLHVLKEAGIVSSKKIGGDSFQGVTV